MRRCEVQLEALVELVDILDAKLAVGTPFPPAASAVSRARRTVVAARAHHIALQQQQEQQRDGDDIQKRQQQDFQHGLHRPAAADDLRGEGASPALASNLAANGAVHCDNDAAAASSAVTDDAHMQRLVRIVDALVRERAGPAADADTVQSVSRAALAEAQLEEMRGQVLEQRQRAARLERIAERAVRSDEVAERNTTLEEQLETAKRTIERLIQERTAVRRLAGGASVALAAPALIHTAGSTPMRGRVPAPKGEDVDAMRRVQMWRQSSVTGAAYPTRAADVVM